MRARRLVDILGAVAVLVALLGFVFKPSLAVLWAFLLLFGITTVPERVIRALRNSGALASTSHRGSGGPTLRAPRAG